MLLLYEGGKKGDSIVGVRESFVDTTCLSPESPGWNRLLDKEAEATGLRIEGRNGKRLFFFLSQDDQHVSISK